MKGRTVTAEERRYHDKLCREVGCIACRLDGFFNDYVSVHHVEGRTKPAAHWRVLPLCGPHHQGGVAGVEAVHANKSRFEQRYGRQAALIAKCVGFLQQQGVDVPAPVTELVGECV